MHDSLQKQYAPCGCSSCQSLQLSLQDDDAFKRVLKQAQKAFKILHEKGTYKPSDSLEETAYKELTRLTVNVLKKGITQEVPAELKSYLEKDVFVFSGLKTHAQLTEARSYLKDENGHPRSYDDFERLVTNLNQNYNRNYLEAEYIFATQSAQSAANWANYSDDTQRYYLQYRTANDNRVRDTHEKLHNVTLPKDDPFWDDFYPPNGWGCRCHVVEVLARNYDKSNSEEAKAKGEKAVQTIGKNGKVSTLFQFNAGKDKVVFPPDYSYSKMVGADLIVKTLASEKKYNRYEGIDFEKIEGIKNKGILEIFKTGRQNPQEFLKNKKALTIVANTGGEYRMLPVIEDGNKNPDAFNLKTNELVDIKVAETTNGKNIIQSALKEASKQGVSEVILHLTKEPDSYKNMYAGLRNTIIQNRAKSIKTILVIYPNETIKSYNIDKLRAKIRKG